MPEGHTIHRLAADLERSLTGGPVRATSPQGRFDNGAARIDGQPIDRAEAYGKHLFCSWPDGSVLHIHLGLIGKFRSVPVDVDPGDTIRLRLESKTDAWHLTGPQTCAIITPQDRDAVTTRLGPDPLRRGSTRKATFVERLRATKRPLGVALLDQHVIAGIGNVYRAELLFLIGVNPERPACDLSVKDAELLWDLTVDQLRRGRKWNRIVTVDGDDVGFRVTNRIERDDALYAYKREGQPCRRCHDEITQISLGGRSTWYCPTDQPR